MEVKRLHVPELKEKMDSAEEMILIDCREQAEWDHCHIEAAQFMPLSGFQNEAKKLDGTNKDTQIIIQCRSGKRSLQACAYLAEQGFTNLTNLEGGILDWIENGFPTIPPNTKVD